MSKMLQNYQFLVDENGVYPSSSLEEFAPGPAAGPTALRSSLGITEAAADPSDGRGIYFNTTTGTYLLSS